MYKKVIKAISAVLIFALFFTAVQDLLVGAEDDRTPMRLNGFYDAPEGSLDAVFLGSSATYTFLVAPYVWHEYGITVYPYASQAQPIEAAKFIIEDARKTQPDAIYIVNVSAINGGVTPAWLHVLFDNMPFSVNKLQAVDYICDAFGYTSLEDKMEYVVPIVKYHDRWSQLTVADYNPGTDDYMTGNHYYSFLKLSKNVGSIGPTEYVEGTVIPDSIDKAVNDLIQYIEEEDVKVQFVVTPQSIKNREKAAILNATVNKIETAGYDVLDMRAEYEAVGIDFAVDYYNAGHTNMHGAIKTSAYLTEELIDKFDLKDKRGDDKYEHWNVAADKYYSEFFCDNLIDSDMKYIKTDLSEFLVKK